MFNLRVLDPRRSVDHHGSPHEPVTNTGAGRRLGSGFGQPFAYGGKVAASGTGEMPVMPAVFIGCHGLDAKLVVGDGFGHGHAQFGSASGSSDLRCEMAPRPGPTAAMGTARGAAGRAACPQPAAATPRTSRPPPSPRPTPAVRIARVPSCPPSRVRPRDDPPPSPLCRRPVNRTPISQPAAGRRRRSPASLR
jgi:hypothetical protein